MVINLSLSLSLFAGIPKNGSVPTFDRVRKHSTGDRFKPSLAAIKASSRADVENGEVRKNTLLKRSTHSLTEGRTQNTDDSVSSKSPSRLNFRINWLTGVVVNYSLN